MEAALILKVAGIGLLVTVAYQILSRAGREEQAMLTTLAGVIVVLMMLIPEISQLFSTVKSLFDI